MIRFRGVSKRFPGTARDAVEAIDLDVPEGEILGLVGRNGAGKSTLLRLGAGLLRPTTGRIEIDGYDLDREPAAARRSLGWVPEVPRFVLSETPYSLLTHLAELDGQRPGTAANRARDGLSAVGLSAERDEPVRVLSQGQSRRLALAAAWLEHPRRLLYDEVTNGLDPEGRRILEASLRELRRRGGSAILASHRLEEVEAWCDRVVVMAAGKIVASVPTGPAAPAAPRRVRIVLEPPAPDRLDELRSFGTVHPDGSTVSVEVPTSERDVISELAARGFRIREVRSIRDDLARWLDSEAT